MYCKCDTVIMAKVTEGVANGTINVMYLRKDNNLMTNKSDKNTVCLR